MPLFNMICDNDLTTLSNKALENYSLKVLQEIMDRCIASIDRNHLSGIMGGKEGLILPLAHYASKTKNSAFRTLTDKLIERLFEDVNNGFSHYSLAGGLAGYRWLIRHLNIHGYTNTETVLEFLKITPFLHKVSNALLKHNDIDYLHGASGIALTIANEPENKANTLLLNDYIDGMLKQTIHNKSGLFWRNRYEVNNPHHVINFSLSHGMPSFLLTLILAAAKTKQIKAITPPIKQVVSFIKHHLLHPSERGCYFPSWINQPDERNGKSRLAWCYGDPGSAIALMQIADIIQDRELKTLALTILKHSTTRTNPTSNLVNDPFICHGAAGLALIYFAAYRNTGITMFKTASNRWYRYMLLLTSKELSLESFEYQNNALLTGYYGVAMTIMTLNNMVQRDWLYPLLINI